MFSQLKLGSRCTLILLLVFVVGTTSSWYWLSHELNTRAEAEVVKQAEILLETMLAVRSYTGQNVNKYLKPLQSEHTDFIRESAPSFSANKVFANLRKKDEYKHFRYKEATLNPTNVEANQADAFETLQVEAFRADETRAQITGSRELDGQQLFFVARPIAITDGSCLSCHSTPERAPPAQIATYGDKAGFGWKMNEIVGARMVYVPSADIFAAGRRNAALFTGVLAAAFAVVMLVINVFLRREVILPLGRLAAVTEKISAGGGDASQMAEAGRDKRLKQVASRGDELGQLATLFNSMAGEVYSREMGLREAHIELKRREAHYRSLIESATDGTVIVNDGGRIRYASPAVRSVLGVEPADLIGGTLFDYVHKDDHPTIRAAAEKTRASEHTGPRVEWRCVHPDGKTHWIESVGLNLLDDPILQGVVINLRDVTERRDAARLAEARDAAERANKAKSQFLANMSHELRTPLNAIIGYSEMLEEEAEELGEGAFVADLRKIHGAGKHLLALINDLLDLSKIEAGKMDLFLEDFDVAEAINDVVTTVAPLVGKNNNTLEIRVADDGGVMRADLTKLRQALFNLLSNAAKFTKDGKITIDVARESVSGKDWMRFRVSDSGVGMNSEQLARIFDAFAQADASTTRQFGGTGLGLAITRLFCRMMGGEIDAESQPGTGSTFTIRLPATVDDDAAAQVMAADDDAAAETTPAPPSPAADAKTILVIDDDPVVHDLMRRTLTREGYHVTTAGGGEEGIRLARALKPDVITLDVMMPGKDGWAVLTELKADSELADIPVIMVTIVDEKKMGYALGAAAYMTKPIDFENLSDVLRRLEPESSSGPVLVVEDDAELRELERRALEKAGMQVVTAENGRAALERIGEGVPRIILLDLMMPEMDGFEFLDALRKKVEWRSIPVIVVTAKEITPAERKALQGRVSQILEKGAYDLHELLDIVRAKVASYTKRTVA